MPGDRNEPLDSHDRVLIDDAGTDASRSVLQSSRWLPLVGIAAVAVVGFIALSSNQTTSSNPAPDALLDNSSPATSATAPGPTTGASAPSTSPLLDDDGANDRDSDEDARPSDRADRSGAGADVAADGLPQQADLERYWTVDPIARAFGELDHLVAITDGAYVAVDIHAGRVAEIPLPMQLTELGAGLDTNTFYARNEIGEAVYVVAGESIHGLLANRVDYFAISARPGRVWIGVPNVPDLVLETDQYGIYYDTRPRTASPGSDPRYVYEPGGGLYRMGGVATALVEVERNETEYLGPHQPLATSENAVVGRVCDADLQCRIERQRVGEPWRPVVEVDATAAPTVAMTADGSWIAVQIDAGDRQGVTLWPQEDADPDGLVTLEYPEASEVFFSVTSDRAYVIEDTELVMIDLVTGAEFRTRLPRTVVDRATSWIAVPALAAVAS